jgi:hypothetical protein
LIAYRMISEKERSLFFLTLDKKEYSRVINFILEHLQQKVGLNAHS